MGGSGTDTSLIDRTNDALLPLLLRVPISSVTPAPPRRPANAVAYPRVPPIEPWSLPLGSTDANADRDRRGGVPARRATAALLPEVAVGDLMGLKTMGDDDLARTKGITLDKYDMMEKIKNLWGSASSLRVVEERPAGFWL